MTLGPLDEPEQVWCAGQASTAVSEPISRPIPSHASLGLSRRTLLTPRPYSPLATGPGVTVFQCPLLSSASSPVGHAPRHHMVDGTHSFPVPAAPWDRPHVTAWWMAPTPFQCQQPRRTGPTSPHGGWHPFLSSASSPVGQAPRHRTGGWHQTEPGPEACSIEGP